MTHRLVIMNDFDAPQPRMIALIRPAQAGGFEWTYISRWKQLSRYRGWSVVGGLKYITPLEVFGVAPVIEQLPGDDFPMLRVVRFAESLATYPDGTPRQWQHDLAMRTGIRTIALARVRLAIKSLPKIEVEKVAA